MANLSTITGNVLADSGTALTGLQPISASLTSISGLTYASTSFVKMSAAGTFALDTSTYTIGGVTGTGTANYVPKFTSASVVGNSLIYDNGTLVGIGYTSDPTSGNKLAVAGAGYFSSSLFASQVTANTSNGFLGYINFNYGNSNFASLNYYAGGTSTVFSVTSAGVGTFSSTVTATNFILSSDRNLKDNIAPISTESLNIDYKSFSLKSDPNQKRYGVIAQEVEVDYPELVYTDKEGVKSVAYIDLLIREIAALKERIIILEAK